MRILLFIIIMIHGLIHIMGFLKAYELKEFEHLTIPVSKNNGIIWLVCTILFIATAIVYLFKSDFWWILGFIAVLVSQVLIFYFWKDARYGTIINVLVMFMAFVGYQSWKFENTYKKDLANAIDRTKALKTEILTKEDIAHLPGPVRNYLEYTGAINKPKVINMKAEFKAQMRSKTQDWFKLTAEQHNFFDQNERLFFMKAKVKGLPTLGYHVYRDGKATMLVKLLSLFPVAKVSGEKMFEAETVTLFNDMCFLAPATLVDKNIEWKKLDNNTVHAKFTNSEKTISATLHFNEKGELMSFVSDDRYDVNEMEKFRFSTPLKNYKNFDDCKIASYGEARWHYPDEIFTYGKYTLKKLEYNLGLGQD